MNIIKASKSDYEDYFDTLAIEDALELMGFRYLEMNFYRREDPQKDLVMYGETFSDAVIIDVYEDNQKISSETLTTPEDLIQYVEGILKSKGIENVKIVEAEELDLADNGLSLRKKVEAKSATRTKLSTKDFADKLIRVKSSNVWAYAFNPKDEYIGDMLMQFKGPNGGPDDIYIYYDVPSKIWRRLVASPSVGHAFWQLIRNKYKYAKLTGDKRTKLPNGI